MKRNCAWNAKQGLTSFLLKLYLRQTCFLWEKKMDLPNITILGHHLNPSSLFSSFPLAQPLGLAFSTQLNAG